MIENKGTIRLENEKLILRKFEIPDCKEFFEGILQDRKLQKYYMIPYKNELKEAKIFLENVIKRYDENGFYCWAIEEKETHKLVGMINVPERNDSFYSCEIGYCIIQSFRQKGYASLALKTVIEFMSSIGFHRITGGTFLENEISGKVMENVGMKKEGIRRDEVFYQGKFHDVVEYIWINEE